MKYKFIKVYSERYDLSYPWMLYCNDFDTLLEHTEKYMGAEIKNGMQDLITSKQKNEHTSTTWSTAVDFLAGLQESNILQASGKLEFDVLQGKVKHMRNSPLLLRDSGSYMTLTDDFEITEVKEMEEMVYPNYSKSDIKISQWPNGLHFYAKIGMLDVVDKAGNQKWDTWKEAKKAAVEFFGAL